MKKKLLVLITIALIVFLSSCVEISLSEVDRIHVNWQPQDAYLVDEEVILDDIRLTAYFDDGSDEEFSLANSDVSLRNGYYEDNNEIKLDTRAHGDYDIRVSYQGVSVTLSFSVYDAIVTTEGAYYPNPNPSASEPLYVSGDSIQDAIDKETITVDNRWIAVNEGVYTEVNNSDWLNSVALQIDKPLLIRAIKNVIIDPETVVDAMINVTYNGPERVHIQGFIFEAKWKYAAVRAGNTHTYSTPITLHDNFLKTPPLFAVNAQNAIQIYGDYSEITDNTIFVPISELEYASTGVFNDSSHTLIKGNTFFFESEEESTTNIGICNARYSLGNDHSIEDVSIVNNTFVNVTRAISIQILWGSGNISGVDIQGNEFINVEKAIQLESWGDDATGVISDVTFGGNVFEGRANSDEVFVLSYRLGGRTQLILMNGVLPDLELLVSNNTFHDIDPKIVDGEIIAE